MLTKSKIQYTAPEISQDILTGNERLLAGSNYTVSRYEIDEELYYYGELD